MEGTNNMSKKLKEKIFELRDLGKSYDQIVNELNCAKSTISYYCGDGQREKCRSRSRKSRKDNVLSHKIYRFKEQKQSDQKSCLLKNQKILHILNLKRHNFLKNKNGPVMSKEFSTKDLLAKIGENPKCYLTNRSIDLSDSKSYHLDHIMPVSRGGDNSLENCQIACRSANLAKSDMTYEEFVKLCKDVVDTVEKNGD